jgi:transposase
MDFHLDRLLDLPNTTVETCTYKGQDIYLKLRFFSEGSHCPDCGNFSDAPHQNRPILVRDLSIFGKHSHLHVPRRQYYCLPCQSHFTEVLSWIGDRRRYTQRYENYIYRRVQHSSIEEVSREEGLSWDQVSGIVKRQYALKKIKIEVKQNV